MCRDDVKYSVIRCLGRPWPKLHISPASAHSSCQKQIHKSSSGSQEAACIYHGECSRLFGLGRHAPNEL